jgi:hypothetical protein
MTVGLKTILLFFVLSITALGCFWIFGLIPDAEFKIVAGKALAVMVLLGVSGFVISLLLGKKPGSDDSGKNNKQGPQF